MLLRSVRPPDRERLARLLDRIANFGASERQVALELIDAAIAGSSDYEIVVADQRDEVVGYICFGHTAMTRSSYDLYWIAVAPEHRGDGVGHRLYSALESRVRDAGGGQIRIETSSLEGYEATASFYGHLGFEEAGRLRDFYAPGDDLLVYYKHVNSGR